MNLADYLRELLEQHDEVSVPGLGYFVRERINAFYNNKEGKFYPPCHKVKFVEQLKDDDTFTQYVANKKNISLASSKYFTEKFVSQLREDAARGKYLFADLGSFQSNLGNLNFKPYDKIAADPAFYGYPAININKLGQQTSPENTETAHSTLLTEAEPVRVIEQQQYYEEESERKKPLNIWLIILIAVSLIVFILFGIFQFYPPAFDKLNAGYHKLTGARHDNTVVPVYKRVIKTDTIKKGVLVADTTLKTTNPSVDTNKNAVNAVDTVKRSRFEIIINSYQRLKRAKADVTRYKAFGIDAKILTDAPGPLIKVTGGTYSTYNEAETARLKLVKSKKIRIYSHIIEIKPKK